MSLPILPLDDPRLRLTCEAVSDINDLQFQHENKTLKDTLNAFRADYGFGRGIAAPQIGIAKRFIALNLGEASFTIINPVITWRSEETFTMWDDCMCFPTLLVMVRRHASISLRFIDEQSKLQEWTHLTRAVSELLQHEINHLDGVLAIDLAVDERSVIQRADFDANREAYIKLVDYVIAPTIS
jgi:peptide deformylase